MTDIVKYEDCMGNNIELSADIIRKHICTSPELSSQEIVMFLKLCEYQRLNPYLREVHLIKYGKSPATMVTGIETFRKRASHNPKYLGHEVTSEGEGNSMTATCKVHVHGYIVPISVTVDFGEYVGEKDEYVGGVKTGKKTVNSMWGGKPKTMLKKVAEAQALRMAFPDDFAGLYTADEINTIDLPLEEKPIKESTDAEKRKYDKAMKAANVIYLESEVVAVEDTEASEKVDSMATPDAVDAPQAKEAPFDVHAEAENAFKQDIVQKKSKSHPPSDKQIAFLSQLLRGKDYDIDKFISSFFKSPEIEPTDPFEAKVAYIVCSIDGANCTKAIDGLMSKPSKGMIK